MNTEFDRYITPLLVSDLQASAGQRAWTTFTTPWGVLICGSVPLSQVGALAALGGGKDAIMDPGISHFYHCTAAICRSNEDADEWRGLIERWLEKNVADPGERWAMGTDTGLSSMTLYECLKFGRRQAQPSLPHDCGDFGRCWRLIERLPEWRGRLHEAGEMYGGAWQRIVGQWDELGRLLKEDHAACSQTIRKLTEGES